MSCLFYNYLQRVLHEAVSEAYPTLLNNCSVYELHEVRYSALGDISSPLPLRLSQTLNDTPQSIHNAICSKLTIDREFITPIHIGTTEGFINFQCSDQYYTTFLNTFKLSIDSLKPIYSSFDKFHETAKIIFNLLARCITDKESIPTADSSVLTTKPERMLLRCAVLAETLGIVQNTISKKRLIHYGNRISDCFILFFRSSSLFSNDTKKNCARVYLTQSIYTILSEITIRLEKQ